MHKIFYITLFLYLFIVCSLADFVDYDFFARLIVGKTFFQTGTVAPYDFLSYSATHPWWDHEWGASIIFYFVQSRFGDIGLLLLKTFCLFGAFVFFVNIIKLRRKILYPDKNFSILNSLFFFVMLQPLGNLVFSLRCHHFTFFFFAIWLYVLEKSRLEKNYRILWVLPLLMMVWSNIHGGCFTAMGVLGIYIIGQIISKKPFLPYVYVFFASFILMFVNPYGFEYVKFLLSAVTMSRPNIVEWQPLFGKLFYNKLFKFKLILICFIVLCIYRFIKQRPKFKDLDITKVLIILIMFILTLKSIRFITYFIFVLIPFCYDDFYFIFSKKLPEHINKIKELVVFEVVLLVFILNVFVQDFKYSNFHSVFPLTEIQFLLENKVKGNIFVPFETGSYTAYKLAFDNFILMDGRYEEVYNPSLNDEYIRNIALGNDGWEQLLNSIHHDIIITYKFLKFYELLKEHPDYYNVMESRKFALFIRTDVYNKIEKPVKVPTSSPSYYKDTLWDTKIDWMKK